MKLGFFLLSILSFSSTVLAETQINAAGATFPYPLYSKWFDEYRKMKPDVAVNYNSIGSGGGIKALQDGTVDFAASDAPMKDEELAKVKQQVIHVPTVLGAVVMSYNLPTVKKPIKLSGDVIAGIYLGNITKWNDKRITELNKGITFPDTVLLPAYRSDGSGTTAIFTDYLAKVSKEWKEKVGAGKAVSWPVGVAGKGNEGVAGLVKQTEGTIGYLELIYAASNGLPVAEVRNKAGKFIEPSPESVTAAAASSLKGMPEDFRVSITDAEGKGAYPISSFTYLLVPTTAIKGHGKEVKELVRWVISPEAQKIAPKLEYAPLPAQLVSKVKIKIETIQVE